MRCRPTRYGDIGPGHLCGAVDEEVFQQRRGKGHQLVFGLQEAGYVSVTKSFQNNRPLTTCSLTAAGKKVFAGYINLLEQIVQQTKPK